MTAFLRLISSLMTLRDFAILTLRFAGTALLVAVGAAFAQSGTNVAGTISTNATWTAANSPYTVTADINVTSGAQLTIQPGVTVYFSVGTSLTITGGTLTAKALAGQPIVLTSARDVSGSTAAPGDWGQLQFTAGTNAATELDGVEIRFGTQVSVLGSSPILNRLVIRNMSGPALSVDLAASPRGVDLTASGNTINGIRVPAGDITGSVTWSMTGIPYVVESGIVAVGIGAAITGISPSVFAAGKTADATIFGTGLTNVETVSIDRAGVSITQRVGASSTAIPITLAVPSEAVQGAATITVIAGAGTVSVPVSITTNNPPVVGLTSPVDASAYTAPASVPLTATASSPNPGGTISRVDFFGGSTLIGTSTTPTNGAYSFSWTSVPAGAYAITARATDSFGGITTSSTASITVFQAPSVEVLTPLAGARASTQLPLAMSARVTSNVSGVNITKVEFISYLGTTLATVTTGVNDVYSALWNNIPGGANWFVVRATDSRGGVTTSPQLNFLGVSPPTASLSSPANNAAFVAPAVVNLVANANSPWSGSGVTIAKVEFYEGANLVATTTNGVNSVYSATWTAANPGQFSITAKAYDSSGGITTTSAASIKVGATPIVTLTSPAAGAVFVAGANVSLSATATSPSPGGTISKVDFLQGNTVVATAITNVGGVFNAAWTNVPAGPYSITARATDNIGLTAATPAITIEVKALPQITITSPTTGTQVAAPGTITLSASASTSNAGGSISKVEFFAGASIVGTATVPTNGVYSVSWSNASAGNYTVTAKATDDGGRSRTSTSILVQVNAAPVVAITSPVNNAVVSADPPPQIRATASSPNTGGSISKVEFFDGVTPIGTATTGAGGVFSIAWAGAAAGAHTLTAKATDNTGLTTTSAAVAVTVNAAPGVAIVSPASGSIVSVSGVDIVATATPGNVNATITKVEFYRGAQLVGVSVTAAPDGRYRYYFQTATPGTFSFTAKAYESVGTTSTSAATNITAKRPPDVVFVSPPSNFTILSTAGLPVRVTAVSPNEGVSITEVIIQVRGTYSAGKFAVLTNGEYLATFAPPRGRYELYAEARDSDGLVKSVTLPSLEVVDPPSVQLVYPSPNASFTAPATITLRATASSPNDGGSIARVEFLSNGTKVGEATTPTNGEYTYAWTAVPIGSYVVTAKAIDNLNNAAESAPASIVVSAAALPKLNVTLLTPAGLVPETATQIVAQSGSNDCATGSVIGVIQRGVQSALSNVSVAPETDRVLACQSGRLVASASATVVPSQTTSIAMSTTAANIEVLPAGGQAINTEFRVWLKRADEVGEANSLLLGTFAPGTTSVSREAIPIWSEAAHKFYATINGVVVGSAQITPQVSSANSVSIGVTKIVATVFLQNGTPVPSASVNAFIVGATTSTQTGVTIQSSPGSNKFWIYGAALGEVDVLAQDVGTGLSDTARIYVFDAIGAPTLQLTLQASGKVTGIVRNSAGAPIAGAPVLLFNQVVYRYTTSDAAGRFTFENVSIAPFDLETDASYSYYGLASGTFSGQGTGQTVEVDISTLSVATVSGRVTNGGGTDPVRVLLESGINFIGSSPFGRFASGTSEGDYVGQHVAGPIRLIASDPTDLFRKGLLLVNAPEQGVTGANFSIGNAIGFGFPLNDSSLYSGQGQPYSLRGDVNAPEGYRLSCEGTVMGSLRLTFGGNQGFLSCTQAAGINSDRDEVSFGPYSFKGFVFARRVYVPRAGTSFARVVDTLTNTTSAPLVREYYLDQYSFFGSPISIDDTTIQLVDRGDVPAARPYLKMVKHGSGRPIQYIGNKLTITLLPGESTSIVSYLVARTSCNATGDPNSTCVVADADQIAANLFNGTQPGMYKGLSAAERALIRNFNVPAP